MKFIIGTLVNTLFIASIDGKATERTQELSKTSTTLKFLVLGDGGNYVNKLEGVEPVNSTKYYREIPHQQEVANAMSKYDTENNVEFLLNLGDSFYQNGVESVKDKLWETAWNKVYDGDYPWYSILGNHDYHTNWEAQLNYHKENERWNMPARNYNLTKVFKTANDEVVKVGIIALDTQPIAGQDGDMRDRCIIAPAHKTSQWKWLEDQLEYYKHNADWTLVMGHHPIYSPGKHCTTDALKYILLPLFEKYEVPLYLNGHDHMLSHTTPKAGRGYVTDLITSGSGSKTDTRTWVCEEEEIHSEQGKFSAQLSVAIPGFIAMEVLNKTTMNINYINSKNEIIYSLEKTQGFPAVVKTNITEGMEIRVG